jgi:hypothetical protein
MLLLKRVVTKKEGQKHSIKKVLPTLPKSHRLEHLGNNHQNPKVELRALVSRFHLLQPLMCVLFSFFLEFYLRDDFFNIRGVCVVCVNEKIWELKNK